MVAKMADIAIEKRVSIRLLPDGTICISPDEASQQAKATSARRDGKIWTHQDPDCPPFPVSPRFDRREQLVMEQLVAIGVGKPANPGVLKHYGPSVEPKLANRGYIRILHGSRQKEELQDLTLTEEGMKAWRAMKAFEKKYISL